MTDGIPHIGKLLIGLGIVMIAIGAVLLLSGKISWIGRLPGDIMVQREEFHLLLPLGHKHSAEPAPDLSVLALWEEVSRA